MSSETEQRASRRVRNTGPKWVTPQCLPIPCDRYDRRAEVAEVFALRLARREYGNGAVVGACRIGLEWSDGFQVEAYTGRRTRRGETVGGDIRFTVRMEGGAR